MFVWILVLLLPVIWLIVFKIKRRRMYEMADRFPESEHKLPGIGIAHKLIGNTEHIMVGLQNFSYEAMREGIVTGWLGHLLYFVMVDPVDLEYTLKTCMEKDNLHRFLRKVIGNGGIFAPVPVWRRRRKILVPAFAPKIVESFVEVFSEQSETMAERLDGKAGNGPFRSWPFISTYTLDSVCETAMGVKINAQSNPDTPFLNALNRLLNLVCERIFHLWLQPDWMYRMFTTKYNEHQKHIRVMHGFTDEVIRKKREVIKSNQSKRPEVEDDHHLSLYQRKSFLDLLITLSGSENGYTDTELREEVLTLTIAGVDTSAVAAGYTLMLLAKYPHIQERVYQELLDVFGDSGRPLVKEDLLNLKYLERVIKETLRLYPPVPFIIRKVLEDTKLPSGRVLPAGSGVVVSIWGVHRDPKHWGPDAEHFDPDRFLPERYKPDHPCSFMPFSNGPRNCLGYQYALMSIKTMLSTQLRKFKVLGEAEISSKPYIRVKLDIMMKAVNGYQIALERRSPGKVPNGKSSSVPNGKNATVPNGKNATMPYGENAAIPNGNSTPTGPNGTSDKVKSKVTNGKSVTLDPERKIA